MTPRDLSSSPDTMLRRTATLLTCLLLASSLVVVAQGPRSPAWAGATPGTFPDVSTTHPFYGHIEWMAEEGVSTGYVDGTYRPSDPVTRGAMAAFLYRIAGAPPFTPTTPGTFPDVGPSHPFFDEVEWLASEAITVGFPDGRFRPGVATSRGAMAVYLYRSSGSPAFVGPATASFSDVSLAHPYSHEVEWLDAQEVTNGFADGSYRPTTPVTRQSMSAFLFRVTHLAPTLEVEGDFLAGLGMPWDLAWAPDGGMLFDTITGGIYAVPPGEGEPSERLTGNLTDPQGTGELADFHAWGESGMTGLVLDPGFEQNRTFYTCQIETDRGNAPGDGDPDDDLAGQVVSWTVAADYSEVARGPEVLDLAPWFPIDGSHLGCRMRFDGDQPGAHLLIATGDLRCGTNPQDLAVRAGKVLRIDVDPLTGEASAPADNPFVGDDDPATDDHVYTYGHRNPQGLALRPETGQMFSVEHGGATDDEVNLLDPGANFGWNPLGTADVACADAVPVFDPPESQLPSDLTNETDWYDGELRSMTDLVAYPDARLPVWSSNGPTIATSGAGFLEGESWGGWEGGLMVAALKGRQVRVLFFTESGVLIEERRPAQLDGAFGRLRTVQMGPDEDVFVTTSKQDADDRIIRISATP